MKTKIKPITFRLVLMLFLEFAVWGAYLTSLGRYLGNIGLGSQIKWFFAMQGIVSIFMPTLMGILADKKMEAQKVLSLCHGLAGIFMAGAGIYCMISGDAVQFAPLFILYSLSVAFFMPTIALVNSVSYNAMAKEGMDPVKEFPPIRVFGTVGFICAMLTTNFAHFKGVAMHLFELACGLRLRLGHVDTRFAGKRRRHHKEDEQNEHDVHQRAHLDAHILLFSSRQVEFHILMPSSPQNSSLSRSRRVPFSGAKFLRVRQGAVLRA